MRKEVVVTTAAVLDVGKTHTKLSLWDASGRLLHRRSVRSGLTRAPQGYAALDVEATETWLAEGLLEMGRFGPIGAIVPVAHGAAAAVVDGGALVYAPPDYESPYPAAVRAAYEAGRDPFDATGSPLLPAGLNLGLQLHALEACDAWPETARIVTYPQYWAWRLCGVASTEVSSLGCHTDLWRPVQGRPSALAERRGWAARLAPLRLAGEVLGRPTPEWRERAGLDASCRILCGLHDSNAALLAAQGHSEIAGCDATVLSTGTWFVALRTPAFDASFDPAGLQQGRDVLVNVDVAGRPAPSARYMGGREAEALGVVDRFAPARDYDAEALLSRLPHVLGSGLMALPTFAPGVGPYPDHVGAWTRDPADALERRTAADLYLALVADAALDLIGSRQVLLVEGRFAQATIFVRALASLRPRQSVYVSHAHDDVPYGALRLLWPHLAPASALIPVEPIGLDLTPYATAWAAAALAPAQSRSPPHFTGLACA